jgi:adenylate kinase family enzyme
VRRVAVVGSASGNGKTTVGRQLASALGVPFVELDALVHGPGWTETSDELLRAQLAPILVAEGWVIDGNYERKLGPLVLGAADLIVWLDLPIWVWLPRLAARTWRRIRVGEQLWNGNRETAAGALWGRDALFAWALRAHFRHRRELPRALRDFHVVRLRTQAAVEQFLDEVRAASS